MSNEPYWVKGGRVTGKIEQDKAMKRIQEYNKNPNRCIWCNKEIIAPYGKKLRNTLVKKFCSKSCSTRYKNEHCIKNRDKTKNNLSIIESFSDEDIKCIFHGSVSIKDFLKKLGYKNKYIPKCVNDRLNLLQLDINEIKVKKDKKIEDYTKGELFSRYSHWSSARSTIQGLAKMTYDKSNRPKKCIICQYEHHYDVAHIKSVSSFSDDALISEINDVNNLIALCPNHHWEYDHEKLDISPYLENLIM